MSSSSPSPGILGMSGDISPPLPHLYNGDSSNSHPNSVTSTSSSNVAVVGSSSNGGSVGNSKKDKSGTSVTSLLNHLAGSNTLTGSNFSLLVEAIKNDDKEYINDFCKQMLIGGSGGSSPAYQGGSAKMPKLDFKDLDGRNAIHYCIEYDAFASLETLLSCSLIIDLNHKDRDEWTPLHYAALFDRIECALVLIQNQSVNINCLTNEGWTPLHICAWRGHNDFANMLMEKKAKLNIKNKHGQTPYQLALNSHHKQLAQDINNNIQLRDSEEDIINTNNQNNNNNSIPHSISNGENLSLLYQDVLSSISRGNSNPILDDGVNYNYVRDINGVTALHLASLNGMVDLITLLLDRYNMNVNVQDQTGRTPLHYASYSGKSESIKVLIRHGGAINYGLGDIINNAQSNSSGNLPWSPTSKSKKEFGITALHEASSSGDVKSVSCLLQNGATVNCRSYFGTPLHYAASTGSSETIKLLLQSGADVRAKNYQLMTPLHIASFHNHTSSVQLLLTVDFELNQRCDDGSSSLLKAVQGASGTESREAGVQCVQLLLERGADPSLPNEDLETPLHVASQHGLSEIAQVLLGRGANIEACDKWGETPLFKACAQNHTRVLELLLEMGSKITAENVEGETPLHLAIRYGASECAAYILSRSCSTLDTVNKYGESPLHYACSTGSIEMAMLLLEKGAKPNVPDTQGDIPLMVALRKGSTEIALALVRWSVQGGTNNGNNTTAANTTNNTGIPTTGAIDIHHHEDVGLSPLVAPMLMPNHYYERALHAAALNGYSDCVLALLGVGADINDSECYGNTPLHGAASSGNADLVDMMITMGADVHRTNKDQVTPLHVAALSGHPRVVEVLMTRGSNCSKCDRNGNTALHCASLAGDVNSINLMMKTNQVLIDVKNAKQWTPLHMASSAGHLICARYLINNGSNSNAKDISGDTAYNIAMSNGHLDMAAYLKNIKPKKKFFG